MDFFGWIILSEYASYEEEVAKEELPREPLREEYKAKVALIQQKIDESTKALKEIWEHHRPFIDNIFNDSISIAGMCNKKPDWFESDILGLYEYVAKILPGSYGLLYYCNADENEDVFNVLVMRNGKLEHKLDPFLSPLFKNVDSY